MLNMTYKASSDVFLVAPISGSDTNRRSHVPTNKEILLFQCSTHIINSTDRNTVIVGERSIRIEDDTISVFGGIEALERSIKSMKNIQVISFEYIPPPKIEQQVETITSVDTQVAV